MEAIMSNPVQRRLVWDRHLALIDYNSGLIGAKEEGLDEGERKGRLEAAKENARRMKADGLDAALIEKYTDFSVADIVALVGSFYK